jgi:hypothetical protein
MEKKLKSWLSLSPDTFKSRRAQLSVTVVIPGRAQREPGISRFRVWSFGPSRNDGSWRREIPGLR